MKHSPAFLKLVDRRRKKVRETNPKTVKRRMDNGDDFILVDIREESEWAAGRLPNSIYLGKGIIERDIENSVPDKESEIILYCGGGFRSVLAADNLRLMGYKNVLSMDGGWREWIKLGYPIVGGKAAKKKESTVKKRKS
ncbi:MAG: rhodanese-like domain-containing protein [Bacteroidota bacterium]